MIAVRRLAGDLRAEAGPGDPAADDDDVKIRHPSRRRLRIGKPRRLEVIAMINGAFTEILLARLPRSWSWRR